MKPPVFIIGAPRSGTNILRDVLSSYPSFLTWDCDEINYIWRHGNLKIGHDQLGPEQANPSVRRFIFNKFITLYRQSCVDDFTLDSPYILEKTCANTLRLPFLHSVFKKAFYIHIVRDPFDAIPSALVRWGASIDPSYLFRKAMYIPVGDIPRHAVSYLSDRLHKKFLSPTATMPWWGPRYKGYEQDCSALSVNELAIKQWCECRIQSEFFFRTHPTIPCLRVNYNDFTSDPYKIVASIYSFLDLQIPASLSNPVIDTVNSNSVGKGQNSDHALKLLISKSIADLPFDVL